MLERGGKREEVIADVVRGLELCESGKCRRKGSKCLWGDGGSHTAHQVKLLQLRLSRNKACDWGRQRGIEGETPQGHYAMFAARKWEAPLKGVHVPPTPPDFKTLKSDEARQDGLAAADVFRLARAIADHDFELANEEVCCIGEGGFGLVGGENK